MRAIKQFWPWCTWIVGAVWSIGSKILDALDVAQIGLSYDGWMTVGLGIFFTGIAVLLVRWRKEQTREGEFHFGFNASSVTTKDGRILLGVSCFPARNNTIESLQLEYNGKRFRPKDWKPIKIEQPHTENYTFDLDAIKAIADESLQEAVFLARVDGKEFRSYPFNIYRLLGILVY